MAPTITAPDLVLLRPTEGVSPAARRLLDRAADFDAEMGFGPRRRHGRDDALQVIEVDTCLHRHDVVHADDYVLAAVLVVREVRPGVGVVEFVVDPERRSIGVATAVVERLGTDASGPRGWADTGLRTLRAVAYGCHPAAERLARRFALRDSAVRHHLLLPAEEPTPAAAGVAEATEPDPALAPPPFDGDLGEPHCADALLRHDAGVARIGPPDDTHPAEILGVAAPGAASAAHRHALAAVIAAASAHLRATGAGPIEALVDGADEDVLEAFRIRHFEHDRSDAVFRIG
jgi:mycothiol synthase